MKKLWNMLKKDEETISIGRLCAVLAMVLFIVVSLYLGFTVKTWGTTIHLPGYALPLLLSS
ncbi:MAG: hypothetical protein ACLT4X_02605 [Phascolarctobacterium sp.]